MLRTVDLCIYEHGDRSHVGACTSALGGTGWTQRRKFKMPLWCQRTSIRALQHAIFVNAGLEVVVCTKQNWVDQHTDVISLDMQVMHTR